MLQEVIYPRLVFKNGGKQQRAGGSYDHLAVIDSTDHQAALASGWFDSLEEAISGVKAIPDDAPPTREELKMKAKELGLKFGPNTGDEKLLQMIDAAISERNA